MTQKVNNQGISIIWRLISGDGIYHCALSSLLILLLHLLSSCLISTSMHSHSFSLCTKSVPCDSASFNDLPMIQSLFHLIIILQECSTIYFYWQFLVPFFPRPEQFTYRIHDYDEVSASSINHHIIVLSLYCCMPQPEDKFNHSTN